MFTNIVCDKHSTTYKLHEDSAMLGSNVMTAWRQICRRGSTKKDAKFIFTVNPNQIFGTSFISSRSLSFLKFPATFSAIVFAFFLAYAESWVILEFSDAILVVLKVRTFLELVSCHSSRRSDAFAGLRYRGVSLARPRFGLLQLQRHNAPKFVDL